MVHRSEQLLAAITDTLWSAHCNLSNRQLVLCLICARVYVFMYFCAIYLLLLLCFILCSFLP